MIVEDTTNNVRALLGADNSVGRVGTDSNHNFTISTNDEERLTVDTDGRLLVGHNSSRDVANVAQPSIQIEGTNVSTSTASIIRNQNDANGPILALSKSRGTSTGANTVVQDNDITGAIHFAGADGTDLNSFTAWIQSEVDGTPGGNDMPGRLTFHTTADGAAAPTERMRITSTGQMRLAGAGITFNGDTAAANELDDYEEGTFDPAMTGATTDGTYTYNTRSGHYTKIGDLVNVTIKLTNITTDTAGAGDININLPFTSANNGSFAVGSVVLDSFNVASNVVSVACRNDPNTDVLDIHTIRDDTTDSPLEVTDKSNNNADIFCTISYRAA